MKKKLLSRIIQYIAGVTFRSNKRAGFVSAHMAPCSSCSFASNDNSAFSFHNQSLFNLNKFSRLRCASDTGSHLSNKFQWFPLYQLTHAKSGFTLAEVLITLGIIGVVAAMTLPALIQKQQDKITVTKLKKIYSVLQNATIRSILDNGELSDWYSEDAYGKGQTETVRLYEELIKPYYSIAKECISGTNNSSGYKNCGYTNSCFSTYNDKNSCPIEISTLKVLLVLADGSVLAFRPVKTDLTADGSGKFAYYWAVYFDVNGPKSPNQFGKDIFIFNLSPYHNKVVPAGLYKSISSLTLNDKSTIDSVCTTSGLYCSAKVFLDGWRINY